MALSYRRFLYTASHAAVRAPFLMAHSKRFASDDQAAKPYRPWPCEEYRYPPNAEYWFQQGYRPQDATADAYEVEEVHLSEIEARLARFGEKYSHSDRLRNLWNEYGWQDDDERPYSVYGAALAMSKHEEEKWGPGKKIVPTHYMHSTPHQSNRQPIPPISYMNGEQIRRVRGRLARFREWPQEVPSIWKSWNPYVTIAAISFIGVSKELYFFNSHDFKELFYLWGTWAFVMSIGFDWMVWYLVSKTQEDYDRLFLPLQKAVDDTNKILNQFDALPKFRSVFEELVEYRKDISERVLQRTLSNRVQSILDLTAAKLEQRMVEERAAEAEITSRIRREAIAASVKHFQDPKIQSAFTAMVIKDFTAGDAAKLVTGGAAAKASETGVFKKQFDADMKTTQKNVYDDARQKGTLPWSFRSEDERTKARLSPQDKEKEFQARVNNWVATHNPVTNASLA